MTETWKDIEGFKGMYQISNLGNVKSLSRLFKARKGVFVKIPTRILTPKDNGAGYLKVDLSRDGTHSQRYIHRLVAEGFIKQIKGKTKVNHIDGDRSNNKSTNLEWCTPKENSVHARRVLDRYTTGENHPLAKLTGKEVLDIRDKKSKELNSSKELSILYGVTREHINAIVRRKIWKEI